MANQGFSAVKEYFGTFSGLTPKSSSDGASSQLAECVNNVGDVIARDEYGAVIAPSVEYAVTGNVDLSAISLGKVHTIDNKRVMLTSVEVSTSAGSPPTVSMSGVEIESDATDQRMYPLEGTLTPRARAQDVAGALQSSVVTNCTSISASFSVESAVDTVSGDPVASDCYNGKVEVSATMADHEGTNEITKSGDDWYVSSAEAASHPDAGYIERTMTLVKSLTGQE